LRHQRTVALLLSTLLVAFRDVPLLFRQRLLLLRDAPLPERDAGQAGRE
jgi:hypothetical protein